MSAREPATEAGDPATATIDRLDSTDLARTLVAAQRGAFDAATAAAGDLALAIDAVAAALAGGGCVVLFGAGSSGRLAVLDAAELPPTFGVAPGLVRAIIAGGERALRAAIEGAEDDATAGIAAAADSGVGPGDVVIGLSASGGAPFVCAALLGARERGALTIGLVNASDTPLAAAAHIAIFLDTGAEAIAGSTRLKAGTAQKIALNTISTGAMIRLGKTYRNHMIDVVATNVKLHRRAVNLVQKFTGATDAAALLATAAGRVKTAIVMARLRCDRDAAEAALARVEGRLADLIGP